MDRKSATRSDASLDTAGDTDTDSDQIPIVNFAVRSNARPVFSGTNNGKNNVSFTDKTHSGSSGYHFITTDILKDDKNKDIDPDNDSQNNDQSVTSETGPLDSGYVGTGSRVHSTISPMYDVQSKPDNSINQSKPHLNVSLDWTPSKQKSNFWSTFPSSPFTCAQRLNTDLTFGYFSPNTQNPFSTSRSILSMDPIKPLCK